MRDPEAIDSRGSRRATTGRVALNPKGSRSNGSPSVLQPISCTTNSRPAVGMPKDLDSQETLGLGLNIDTVAQDKAKKINTSSSLPLLPIAGSESDEENVHKGGTAVRKCDAKRPYCSQCLLDSDNSKQCKCTYDLIVQNVSGHTSDATRPVNFPYSATGRKLPTLVPKAALLSHIARLERELAAAKSQLPSISLEPDDQRYDPSKDQKKHASIFPNSPINYRNSSQDSAIHLKSDSSKIKEPNGSLVENLTSTRTWPEGDERHVGASSVFSIGSMSMFSTQGLELIRTVTGDSTFSNYCFNTDNSAEFGLGTTFEELLGPTEENFLHATGLRDFQFFFLKIQPIFPILDRDAFEARFANQALWRTSLSWQALCYAIQAIGCRLCIENTGLYGSTAKLQEDSATLFSKALALLHALLIQRKSLVTVQALTAMAIFVWGSGNTQAEYIFISMAARLAIAIGLHRRPTNMSAVDPAEFSLRNGLFWVVYFLEKTLCMRYGRPSAIDDRDVNAMWPSSNNPLQYLYARFSWIESQAYTRLYQVTINTTSTLDLQATLGSLHNELMDLKCSFPDLLDEGSSESTRDSFAKVFIRTYYLNCLSNLHGIALKHSSWRISVVTGRLETPYPFIEESSNICLDAAAAILHQLTKLEDQDTVRLWLMSYTIKSSVIILFADLINHAQLLTELEPSQVRRYDRLCHTLTLLDRIAQSNSAVLYTTWMRLCYRLIRLAKTTFARCQTRQTTIQGSEKSLLNQVQGNDDQDFNGMLRLLWNPHIFEEGYDSMLDFPMNDDGSFA